ncbi:class II aldolase/adducin family protein [Cellulosimicrobium cellulans]|uniref:class II aldolase/adducin family protein n=1 Tax=Cellulosimicrobium cellulans TaxID=1710 RepID=UPI0020977695|nr:class II aldolase/adducin family protein [Cellulosimicrobium cellulans]MCO7275375.1 class II aldolase/adducin family protein [Cellulosimicrobium cellulans]
MSITTSTSPQVGAEPSARTTGSLDPLPDVPEPPARDVRWELAAALRIFGRAGYEFGFNGHVSARAPEAPGHYWVNPFGLSISSVTPRDLVLVDEDGQVVDPRVSAAINGFAGNLRLHREIDDAAVVVHLHTPSGFAWSSLGRPLEPVTTDAALVAGLQGLTTSIWDGATSPSAVEHARAGARVILQRGHGFVTLGRSVGEAAFYLLAAERAAAANLALVGVPDKGVLPPEVVERWTLRPELARAHFENAFTLVEAEGLR